MIRKTVSRKCSDTILIYTANTLEPRDGTGRSDLTTALLLLWLWLY